jgi:ferredoxin-type protein NapH
MDVLPRMQKRDISCVNCGACIDACNRELGHGKGLFHYSLGSEYTKNELVCKSLKK